jgi:hypothetical protein
MPFLIVAAGIAALLMATSAAHAYDEMSTSCGQAIVHLIINNDKEFGTVYHDFGAGEKSHARQLFSMTTRLTR